MSWIAAMLRSSIGKKIIMAISGLSFCTFLIVHLAGNLTIYRGKESFNAYAEHLHALGPLITIFEFGLLFLGILHVVMASTLFFENKKARPKDYTVKNRSGGRNIGSATMPYTGVALLIFIFVHLSSVHFVDKTNISVFNILQNSFSNISYVCLYIVSAIAASLHVSHGFWSAFQTVGFNHTKYTNSIKLAGSMFSLVIGVGFGFLPIYLLFST